MIELDPLRREIVWEYRAPEPSDFYSASSGSSQRLPGGNTLVADSTSGVAFEVTPDGDVVWRFLNPNTKARGQRATITRIKRYPIEWIDSMLAEAEPTEPE